MSPLSDRRAQVMALLRRRELAFVLVGGINTALGLAVFAVLFALFADQLHYLGALVLAYAIAMTVAFVLHRRFVFNVRGRVLLDYLRFVTVQAGSFGLNAVLLTALVELAHAPVVPAQAVALFLTVCCSYFAHLLFSFRRPPETAQSAGLDGHEDDRGAER
jgi:putative flippase GtrA